MESLIIHLVLQYGKNSLMQKYNTLFIRSSFFKGDVSKQFFSFIYHFKSPSEFFQRILIIRNYKKYKTVTNVISL